MCARAPITLTGAALVLLLAGCERDMYDQPKYEPYEASSVFPDGASARPRVEGTVARSDSLAPARQPQVTQALLHRGHERYDIFCSPCHGLTGYGDGMIVQRGFPHPPSYHTDALRSTGDQRIYDVITKGFGAMYSYADRVPPHDRWAIVAYIRALQLSQHAPLADLPGEERQRLMEARDGR